MKKNKVVVSLAALGLAWGFPLGPRAGQPSTVSEYASGDWFGVRDTLEDHGLKLGVEWKANFLLNGDGGL